MPHATATLSTAQPQTVGLSTAHLQALCDVLQRDIDAQRLPGAVVLVARQGQLAWLKSLGQQDPGNATPMREDSIFRIYSMTKPVVSVAVMMLMERGLLLLSDPISQYLPEFAHPVVLDDQGVAHATAPPTIQDLLRHTAGLTYEFLGDSAVQRQYAAEKMGSRERSNTVFTQTLASLPLMFEPGSTWAYSRATDVLGRLIEVISGHTLGRFLRQEIFEPLAMVDTGFVVPTEHRDRVAQAFAHDPDGGEPMALFDPTRAAAFQSGGGGLMSTTLDYARFLQCLRNQGTLDGVRLLSPATLAFMTADHLGDRPADGDLLPEGHGFGLGFAVRTHAGLSPIPGSVGSYYWNGIAGTSFFVDPSLDLYAVLMIQAPHQREYYRQLFRNLVYAAVV
jgi:CubicO group peptidase (beta-lactamase class C family)